MTTLLVALLLASSTPNPDDPGFYHLQNVKLISADRYAGDMSDLHDKRLGRVLIDTKDCKVKPAANQSGTLQVPTVYNGEHDALIEFDDEDTIFNRERDNICDVTKVTKAK